MPPEPAHERAVRQVTEYYQGNTRRFLRFGGGSEHGAIHREVWGPGVERRDQALLYVNTLLPEAMAPALSESGAAHVLDLGCGVGGTALWLARELDVKVTGITLSPLQVELAKERAVELGLSAQCDFVQADFLELPELAPAHAAVAIESFVHSPNAERFFEALAPRLVAGGRLVICDDLLATEASESAQRDAALDAFRRGWRVHSLLSLEELQEAAARHGFEFVSHRDLTGLLNLGRPRDRVIRALVTGLGWVRPLERFPFWGNMLGGDALQTALGRGWLRYEFTVWQRQK